MLRRLALAAAAMTLATTLYVAAGQPAGATTPASPGTGLLALRNRDLDATTPAAFGVVVMNAWEWPRIAALKAASPAIKVLVYKDMSSTRSYAVSNGADDALLPTGVGYAWADRERPDLFLADGEGRRIEWSGYSGHWWMDVGHPDYIAAWSENVGRELVRNGWDGVFVDNAITDRRVYLPDGWSIPKYPTNDSYRAATETFLSTVAPRLHQQGFLVVPNLGGNAPDMALYRRWTGIAGGGMREHFGRWGSDGNGEILTGWNWSHQLEQQEAAQANGLYLAVAYGRTDDVRFMRYARASFLLGWDGGPSSLLYTPPSAGLQPLHPEWTVDIGLPAAARVAVGAAWTRRYTGGIVAVNPSTATTTVDLGAHFVTPEGATVERVSLGAGSGMVLRNAASTPVAAALPPPLAPSLVPQAPAGAPAPGAGAPGAAAPAASPGYWVLGQDGGVFSYGSAGYHGSLPGLGIRNVAVTLAPTRSGGGYWLLGADGGIFTFGDARYFGSVPGLRLPVRVRAIDLQPTPTGNGYWVLGDDGGIFTFGDARYLGSLPGIGVRNRAIRITPTPSGAGYWILGEDGGVFSFGDAAFHGSVPGLGIRNRSVSMAATPTGGGYWLLGEDGGIFTFGDARYAGSLPGIGARDVGVQIRATRSGAGYYVVSAAGQVFGFGNARALGSPAGLGVRAQDLAVIG